MRSVRTWGPIGRPDTRDAGGSNEGGRRGSDDGSLWPSRMGSHWPSLDNGEHGDERDAVDARDGRQRWGRSRGLGRRAGAAARSGARREQGVSGPGDELVDEGRGTPLLGSDVLDGLVVLASAGRGDDAEPTLRVMDADGQGTVCLHVHLLRRRRGLATGTPPQAVAYATGSSGGRGAVTRARTLRVSPRFDPPQERSPRGRLPELCVPRAQRGVLGPQRGILAPQGVELALHRVDAGEQFAHGSEGIQPRRDLPQSGAPGQVPTITPSSPTPRSRMRLAVNR